ncbi:O-antigen ligase family protein [Candidatus Sumerlaeota bacterium]|nr:O-antigen ligase family protein [Candidatus Sumerlaeota bacterium]
MNEAPAEEKPNGHRRHLLVRFGDALATFVVALTFLGGFVSHGYADEGWARVLAWMACGTLGCWAVIGYALGRWSGPRMASARWFLALLGVAALLATMQTIPLPADIVQKISPVWRGITESFQSAGIPVPDKLTLAVAPEKAWLSLRQLIAAMLFFAGVILLATHRATAMALIVFVSCVSMLEGFFGLFNYLIAEAYRASGSVYNANHYAVIVIIGLPLYFTGLMEWKRHSEMMSEDILGGRNPLLIFIGLGIIAGLGWITSLSRSSVIVTTIVVGILAMMEAAHWTQRDKGATSRSVANVLIGSVIALMLLFVGSLFFQGVLDRIFSGDAMSGNSRVRIWRASLQGLRESNYLGVGIGGSEFSINRFADYPLVTEPIWSHSDVLQWLCDLGVPACLILAVILFFFGRSFLQGLKSRAERSSWNHRRMHRAALAGVAIALLHAALDFHLRIPQVGFMVLTLVALTLQPGIFKVTQKADS